MVNVQMYTRNPLDVQAVQVLTTNIGEVAAWCGGTIFRGESSQSGEQYLCIRLDIPNAGTKVRTEAVPGDWILLSDSGYRIYTEKALSRNFIPKIAPVVDIESKRRVISAVVYEALLDQTADVNNKNTGRNARAEALSRLVDRTTSNLMNVV